MKEILIMLLTSISFVYNDDICKNNPGINGHYTTTQTGSTAYYRNGTQNLKDGKWHLIGMTWKIGQQLKLYVDGIEEVISFTNGTPPASISTTTNPLSIGRLNFNGTWYYGNIMINNPRVRNRALSAKEIEQLYYSQKGSFVY